MNGLIDLTQVHEARIWATGQVRTRDVRANPIAVDVLEAVWNRVDQGGR
ncbi:hypothetical protein [Cryobacterium sp. Y11]|nr:hypothetical protein [Cryobacterium sp. Y11]